MSLHEMGMPPRSSGSTTGFGPDSEGYNKLALTVNIIESILKANPGLSVDEATEKIKENPALYMLDINSSQILKEIDRAVEIIKAQRSQ